MVQVPHQAWVSSLDWDPNPAKLHTTHLISRQMDLREIFNRQRREKILLHHKVFHGHLIYTPDSQFIWKFSLKWNPSLVLWLLTIFTDAAGFFITLEAVAPGALPSSVSHQSKEKKIKSNLSIAEERLKIRSSNFRKKIKSPFPSFIHIEIQMNSHGFFP